MRKHTKEFKSSISTFGRELDSKITVLGTELILEKEDLFSITPITNSTLLKTVMKEVDFESKKQIGIGQEINVKSGVKVNGEYEYIDYGNYSVYKSEYKAETDTYSHICYDKMLKTMIDYTPLDITYPINLREYINAIATKCGLEFADKNSAFANYNTSINEDHFSNGNYTFRDVLDYIAQLVGGWLCINDNDELEIRYPELAKNYDKVSGENVSFTSNVEDEIKTIIVDGKSTQETRSGKNLIKDQHTEPITVSGVTFTPNPDGSIKVEGTATANYTYRIIPRETGKYISIDTNKTYTMSVSNDLPSKSRMRVEASNSTSIFKDIYSEGTNKRYITFEGSYFETGLVDVWFSIFSGYTYDFTLYPQLEKGSTATEYEQYGVSPSPDYPSPIESITEISATVTGKNLLENKTKNSGISRGVTFTLNGDGSYTLNGTNDGTGNATVFLSSSSNPTTLKAGTYYTIPTPNGVQIVGAKIGGGYFQLASSSTNQFTLNEDTQAQIYIQVPNGTTTTYNNIKVYPIISTTPITQTDYEQYKSNSLTINLQGNELCSLPNGTKDELIVKDGRAKIIKRIGKVVLDGSEDTWRMATINGINNFIINNKINDINYKRNVINYISNYFKGIKNADRFKEGTFFTNSNKSLIFSNTNCNSIDEFKTWLSTHNTQVDYELAEPYTETIGEVETLSTFKGVNNVSLVANIQTNMTITYPAEYEELDKHFLKDVNVSFSKKYGAVNSVVFSRGNGSDNIYRKDNASITKNGLTEIKIADNPFLEGDDRENFIQSLFDKINGLEFYIMDVASTGIMYLELGDFYYFNMVEEKPSLKSGLVKSGMRKAQGSSGGKFLCLLMNDEIKITQGLEENIYTDEPEITETDYKTASITDTSIKNAIIQTNKNSAEILLKVNSDEVVSAINLSPEKIKISSAKLDIDAIATFTNSKLAEAGSTVINGANITTGSINCDRLNGGTINGQKISGSTISGGSISIQKGVYYFNMGTSTSNPNCSGLNVGTYGIKAHSDITATGFAITDSDTGKSQSVNIYDGHGHVHYLTFTGGILTKWEYK